MEDEIPIKLWMGIVSGWRSRNISITETSFRIRSVKTKNPFSSSNTKTYSLENALITNLTTPLEFCINTLGEKYDIRARSEKDKETIVINLQRVIKFLNSTKAFSKDYETYKDEIDKKTVNVKNTFDTITLSMTFFQNLFHEMNQKLTTFDRVLKMTKLKKNQEEFVEILNSLCCIREEMKKQFDVIIERVYAYHDEKEPEQSFKNGYKPLTVATDVINTVKENKRKLLEEKIVTHCIELDEDDDITNTINVNMIGKEMIINEGNEIGKENELCIELSNPYNTMINNESNSEIIHVPLSELDDTEDELDSEDDCDINESNNNNANDTKRKLSKKKKEKVIIDYSNNPSLYHSDKYGKDASRLCLPEQIQCSKNMKGDLMKSLTAKKVVLPIYFNEPISMIQKQCEKFYYCDLLKKAAEQSSTEMQLCYICAFIIGEISFNTNRFLKPFNPILGETFEYVDNEKGYRFFGEQVSHDPPITAFIGEGDSFAVYGDTKGKTSVKLLKGVELEFEKKIHIILKKTKETFTFNRPSLVLKGLMVPPMKYDHCGIVTVSKSDCPSIKATITFIEETKKTPLGSFEGNIINNGTIVHLLQGNWISGISYCDPDGNNKVNLLTIEDQDFMHNTTDSYKLPQYSCNFNAITPELKEIIPKGDSRFRPDMRAYEEGKIDLAQELRKKVEGKQSLRHHKFNADKVKHEPMYFKQSGEYVYCYNGKYWNGKEKKKDNDIFDIDENQ